MFRRRLEELVAPVREASVAVLGLLGVGARQVLEPVHEEVAVLLQNQELAEHHVGLKEPEGKKINAQMI